jgi:hypothetical protein
LIEELHADINRAGDGEATALGWAAILNYYEAVDYLLAIPGRTLGTLPPSRGRRQTGSLSTEMWTYLEQKAPELLADVQKPRTFRRRSSDE